ncbi:MAG: hypothetical protein ACE5JZ_01275 [Kiloniellales bacterium]
MAPIMVGRKEAAEVEREKERKRFVPMMAVMVAVAVMVPVAVMRIVQVLAVTAVIAEPETDAESGPGIGRGEAHGGDHHRGQPDARCGPHEPAPGLLRADRSNQTILNRT